MMSASRPSFKLSIIAAAFVMLAAYGKPAQAQDSVTINSNYVRITGLPDDWSHHHLVFSNPGTEQDAIRNGRDEQWHRIVNDPRYVIHQLKRGLPAQGPSGQDAAYWKALVALDAKDRKEHEWDGHDRKRRDKHGNPAPGATEIKGDWGMSMGPLAKAGAQPIPSQVFLPHHQRLLCERHDAGLRCLQLRASQGRAEPPAPPEQLGRRASLRSTIFTPVAQEVLTRRSIGPITPEAPYQHRL